MVRAAVLTIVLAAAGTAWGQALPATPYFAMDPTSPFGPLFTPAAHP